MARWEFKLPDIGEGVTEGEIVAWLVRPGDVVREDQPVVEVMTDKATVTITAPKAGVVLETRGALGEIIPVHDVLVVFELDVAAGPEPAANPKINGTSRAPSDVHAGSGAQGVPGATRASGAPGPAAARASGAAHYFNERPLATPATRKLAREMNVDLHEVPPTGSQGRVTMRDVESFTEGAAHGPSNGGVTQAAHPLHGGALGTRGAGGTAEGRDLAEERIPLAGLRRRIAQKMSLSKSTAAHFTFVEECDATELKAIRGRLAAEAERAGVKLTLLPFVVKAVVSALKRHPMLNSTLDDATGEIVLRRTYNIGIATATEAGLLVPVVKDADRRSILELGREIARLAADARAGKARLEDLQGGTFTITSLGARAGLMATPIINFPEAAILGVHRIKERPVVRDGQIVIGEVMTLSLSFDHRIVDGHVGAAFAYDVIATLEHPDRLLLEMA